MLNPFCQSFLFLFIYFTNVDLAFSIENVDDDCFLVTAADGSEYCAEEPKEVVIELKEHDENLARQIADDHQMTFMGPVGGLKNHFWYKYSTSDLNNKRKKRHTHRVLELDDRVRHMEHQVAKRRVKRDYVFSDDELAYYDTRQRRTKRAPIPNVHPPWPINWPDPEFQNQWYLNGQKDMGVQGAWEKGYSGKGVSVSILDDGIQRDHPDLARNYDKMASYDVNDHDPDPTPQNNGDNKHGTRCAGEVAAIAGNNVCGVGIAFNASIGGVRMLDGPVSDAVEAASLSLNQDHIDIYSASWGPEDDGATFDGPGPLARKAFKDGIEKGRQGKGNIFVWASGNGGNHYDSCSADGYTTSIYTLSISSATFSDQKPWYLEECPSTIATTYSSALGGQPAIVTVDVPTGCTRQHTGTSASAPIAAGIVALALEANSNLTWRDVQHIVLRTANPTPLLKNPGWSKNAVGRYVSTKFGYGIMNAKGIVELAEKWTSVPEQKKCRYDYSLDNDTPLTLTAAFKKEFKLTIDDCSGAARYLEHVHAIITLRYSRRGDLRITLMSPGGTISNLLPPRSRDNNNSGFHQWPFLTVHSWGEDPRGTWTLTIENVGSAGNHGSFHSWSLDIYGTATPAQPGDTRLPDTPVFQGDTGMHASRNESTLMPDYSSMANVGDCHHECTSKGCYQSHVAIGCFYCQHYVVFDQEAYRCAGECPDDYFLDHSAGKQKGSPVCVQCPDGCDKCVNSFECTRCKSFHFLIDIEHRPAQATYHAGQCVKTCPEPLALAEDKKRCILTTALCSPDEYYRTKVAKCQKCDTSCAACTGPSKYDCSACASGYTQSVTLNTDNPTTSCRRCCDNTDDTNCVNCSNLPFGEYFAKDGSGLRRAAIALLVITCMCASFVCCCRWLFGSNKQRYDKLPTTFDFAKMRDRNGIRASHLNASMSLSSSDELNESEIDDIIRKHHKERQHSSKSNKREAIT